MEASWEMDHGTKSHVTRESEPAKSYISFCYSAMESVQYHFYLKMHASIYDLFLRRQHDLWWNEYQSSARVCDSRYIAVVILESAINHRCPKAKALS